MTAVALALVHAVHAVGGTVTLDGGRVRLWSPEPLSPFLLASLRQHKPLLLAYLAEQAANGNQPADTSTTAPVPAVPPPPPVVEAGPWSAGIPDEVARGLGALFVAPSARGILDHHWRTVVNDTLALVDSGQAAQAFALGWSAADLFGCDAVAPWHRLDRAGLMLLLQGREIAQWTASDAALRYREGNLLRFRRVLVPPSPPVAMLWHLLPKRLRPAVGPAP